MRSRHGLGFIPRGALIGGLALALISVEPRAGSVERGGHASSEIVFEEIGSDGTRFHRLAGEGTIHRIVGPQGLDTQVPQVQTVGPEDVIIELREAPLLRRPEIRSLGGLRPGTAAVFAARLSVEAEHDRAEAEVLRVVSQRRGLSLSRSAVITREYTTVFNGFAAKLSREEQVDLRNHPDVRAIHPDTRVHATLDVSVPHVGAPSFWSTYGYKGAGAVIAVIDTGVDYTHADLGGCLGPGCKVIGGYDFVNGDSDPSDDNGHGSHVAGIAAGDGALEGVAPEASVLAYKVLDSIGSGHMSDVIAALERAVDPDENGDTSDRAEVINLSLGSSERNPDSPAVQAIENATASGVLVVASAGNDGPRFFSVGTPGIAPSGLGPTIAPAGVAAEGGHARMATRPRVR